MTSPFEERVRAGLHRSAESLPSWPADADRVVRSGRARRRLRWGTVAAAAVAVLAVTVGVAVARPTAGPIPPSYPRPTVSPTVSPTGSPTRATHEVDTLTADNMIRLEDGRTVRIPLQAGESAQMAWRVDGGWVVISQPEVPAKLQLIRFLTESGELRTFEPAIDGDMIAFAIGGATMAAYHNSTLTVIDLPSLHVRATVVVKLPVGDVPERLFITDSVAVIGTMSKNFGPVGTQDGVVTVDLATAATAATRGFEVLGLSPDGQSAAVAIWQPEGVTNGQCVGVEPIAFPLRRPGFDVCLGTGVTNQAAFSPDGSLVAYHVWGTDHGSSTVRIYRAADLAAKHGVATTLTIPQTVGWIAQWLDNRRLLAAGNFDKPVYACALNARACTLYPLAPSDIAIAIDVR